MAVPQSVVFWRELSRTRLRQSVSFLLSKKELQVLEEAE